MNLIYVPMRVAGIFSDSGGKWSNDVDDAMVRFFITIKINDYFLSHTQLTDVRLWIMNHCLKCWVNTLIQDCLVPIVKRLHNSTFISELCVVVLFVCEASHN
jgi:hypothetical protein